MICRTGPSARCGWPSPTRSSCAWSKDRARPRRKSSSRATLLKLASVEEGQDRGRRYQRAAELALDAEDEGLLEDVLVAARDDKAKPLSTPELAAWARNYRSYVKS